MRTQSSGFLRFLILFAFLLILGSSTLAQNPAPETRIIQAVDNANRTTLKGNVYFLARPEFDRGIAPPDLSMERMTLVLRSSPQQQAALAALLDEQQDQSSPNYHQWLTPAQFGQQFGASDQDIQVITSWLQSQGFQVTHVANGRNVIEFSGTAGQVQQTFHTAIHKYSVPTAAGNEDHWANSADLQIPTALAPVVVGVATLHNFLKSPQHILSNQKFPFARTPGKAPEFTGTNGNNQMVHAVGPGDLATIYNATPLYTASPAINGGNSTIAIVARSNINMQDLDDFRNNFEISSVPFQTVLNGQDPGDLGGNEEVEAILDASYSNALAQRANVDFVVSASTNTTDGVDLSEMFIIDNNLGDVMTESFGGCEQGITAAEAAGISNLAEQAAAQGITYLVSTGDNGSAGCDNPNSPMATHGVSVNILASTPYTVGVGGTMFSEGATPATYWNATNNAELASAKSYIPEVVWNQSCTTASCGSSANLGASSGGVSTIFAKPSWQTGVAGISSLAPPLMRNLPDVSLTAAGHDPYLVCLRGSCQQGEFEGIAGTSASVQAFGGIMALVRQKIGARVGQADYVFYKLAASEALASCNGSQATPIPASTCIFYDTTVGNNAVPGITGGSYPSTVGYDRATGLGSVNITNLVNQWSSVTFAPSFTTLTVNPTSFTHGASATFNITVAPKTGTPSFNDELAALLSSTGAAIDDVTLSSTGTASGSTNNIPGGSTTLFAHYPGNGTLGASDSTPISVVVAAEPSTTTLTALNSSGAAFTGGTFGTPVTLNALVSGQSGFGAPTSDVEFEDAGVFVVGPPAPVVAGGKASFGPFFPAPGSHSVTANYAGDPSFLASVSAANTFTITPDPTTIVVQSNVAQVAPGGSVTLTATIQTTAQGSTGPSGLVTFFSGSTQVGTSNLTTSSTSGAIVRTAQLVTTQLPSGTNSITAQYPGDTNFDASTSPAITVNVSSNPDFTVSASPFAITVPSPGQSATTTITVAGSNGFNSATTFACSGLPSESKCSFVPPSVTGSGTTMLTIKTTAPSFVVPESTRNRFINWPSSGAPIRSLLFGLAALVMAFQMRRRRPALATWALAATMVIGLAACGGGGGGGSTPQNPGTPAVQNQPVTVTATSGTVTHTVGLTVTVN